MIGRAQGVRDRAVRKNDFAMVIALVVGANFLLRGHSLEMTRETGPAMYALSAAAFILAVALPLFARKAWKAAPREKDEYLAKLVGLSAGGGFYFALAIFAIWSPLTGSLLPELHGPQVLGLMLIGASLCWFTLRWRDSRG